MVQPLRASWRNGSDADEGEAAFYDLVIIGGGPAGLAPPSTARRRGCERCWSSPARPAGRRGQAPASKTTSLSQRLSGADLARRATVQARRFGAEIVTTQEWSKSADEPYRTPPLRRHRAPLFRVLIASGMEVRRLEAPGIADLEGAASTMGPP